MNYAITYFFIVVGCYVGEFLIFGFWYKLYSDSNIGYLKFMRKILGYYWTELLHLPDLLKGEWKTDAPSSSSMRCMFAVFIPIFIPSFMLISEDWRFRAVLYLICQIVVFGGMFSERKTEVSRQIDQWVRFLFNLRISPKETNNKNMQKDNIGIKGRISLSKQEIRRNRIFAVIIIVLGVLVFITGALGMISNIKNGFPNFTANPFAIFSVPIYNTVWTVLLVAVIIVLLCYILWTPADRKEAKDSLTKSIEKVRERIEKRLGLYEEIIIDPDLNSWEKAVKRMCNILNIRYVAVLSEAACAENVNGKIAFSVISKEGTPVVVISTRMVNRWMKTYSPKMVYDMVRFILGHELVHIRYKDYSSSNIALRSIISTGVFIWGALGIVRLAKISEPLTYVGSAIVCIGIIIFTMRTFFTTRYWRHVSEYRADRIAYAISGASARAIETVLKINDAKTEVKSIKRKKKGMHPEVSERLEELRRKKKWTVLEYFRYALRMF